MNNLALIEQRTINNVLVEGYYGDKDAWFTRTQIGEALEYDDPQDSIKKIHRRHKNRLDLFSKWGQIDTPLGIREGYVYNLRGVLEICRWSRQPKADEVMDKLYDMAMSVIDKGYYSTMSDMELFDMLACKCLDTPGIYERLNKSFVGDLVKMQYKYEKYDAKVIINEYNRKCRELLKYYNTHLCEDGYKEQFEKLTRATMNEIAEKCPHIIVDGLNKSTIRAKSGMKI